jgi:hypothetical protein
MSGGTIILACRTVAHELTSAVRRTGAPYPVCWVAPEMHCKPDKLREEVQATLDRLENVETVILAFGLCGNGLIGVRSEGARLVLPKTEDCISLLLGSQERRSMLAREAPRYYLTRGWLESEKNIAEEYDYCVRKFGAQRGRRLMRTMLKGYRYFTFIETGGYDSAPYIARMEALARDMGLGHQVIEGSPRFFEKLVTGPWDEEFVVVGPGCPIEFSHFFPGGKDE